MYATAMYQTQVYQRKEGFNSISRFIIHYLYSNSMLSPLPLKVQVVWSELESNLNVTVISHIIEPMSAVFTAKHSKRLENL